MRVKYKQNLAKKEIVANTKSIIGFSSKVIQEITDDLIETFFSILIEKKKINIKNFGSFNIILKKEREGRNPKTKEKHIIRQRNTIKFKVANSLKIKINQI